MKAEPLEEVESKIAFLEHANVELSDVVARQQRDIDALRVQINALEARVQAWRDSEVTLATAEEEKPPHY